MDNKNLDLWKHFEKTDPSTTKEFVRGGGFKGTALSPMDSVKRMTAKFGPMGEGWGITHHDCKIIPGANGESLVFVLLSVWYLNAEKNECVVGPQWGGDSAVVYSKKNQTHSSDDESFKKAATDAMSKCLSWLGIGADIHMGKFDDSKYINTLRKEFEAEKRKENGEAEPEDPKVKFARVFKELATKRSTSEDLMKAEAKKFGHDTILKATAWAEEQLKAA